MTVMLNGVLHAEDEARIAPGDRGFTLGDGLFETMRVKGGVIAREAAHLARLAAGARVIGLALPPLDLPGLAGQLLEANGLEDAVLRLTVSRGAGPRGVLPPAEPRPTVLLTAAPLGAPMPPARLVIARGTRRNERSPLCGIKSLNYLDNILARQEAAAAGADDGLLLNTRDLVAETSIANLFAVLEGELVTPPLADGALPGVMRADILALGARERSLSEADLRGAQEIFLSSSLGLRPVREVEGRALPCGMTPDRLAPRLGLA